METLKARVTELSDEAWEAAVRAYAWPGNVRELENRIKRAVIMAKVPMLQPVDLELPSPGPATRPLTLKEARARVEKGLIQQALASHNWNISRAAEELGYCRQSLHEFIQKYSLQKPSLAEQPPGPTIANGAS